MSWPLYLALKQLFPTGKWGSFYAVSSVVGVMLGVMVLIIVQSVMNGFGHEIRNKMVDVNSHIRIEANQVFKGGEMLAEQVMKDPQVAAAAPYAQGMVMLQYGAHPAFPVIRSIQTDSGPQVLAVADYLLMGELSDLDDESLIVSSGLANSLGLGIGSVVDVYTPLMLERMKEDDVLLPRELEVVGIFETGWNQVDANTVLCTLSLMQELYGLDEGVHGVAIRLQDDSQVIAVADKLNAMLPNGVTAHTWMELDRDFLFILGLEKSMMFFIMFFILVVASFSIASSLMIAVLRKTREIGLLGVMGATPRQIAAAFGLQGLIIGIIGTSLGVLSGLIILHYRNNIVHLFAHVTNSEAALLRYYQFSNLPVHYSLNDFILIISLAIIVSTMAGLFPAWRASRLKPSKALRSE